MRKSELVTSTHRSLGLEGSGCEDNLLQRCCMQSKVGFFIAAVQWLIDNDLAGSPCYHCVEFFAGAAVLTECLRAGGFVCATFEILHDPINEDILSGLGMLRAIQLIVQAPMPRNRTCGVRLSSALTVKIRHKTRFVSFQPKSIPRMPRSQIAIELIKLLAGDVSSALAK